MTLFVEILLMLPSGSVVSARRHSRNKNPGARAEQNLKEQCALLDVLFSLHNDRDMQPAPALASAMQCNARELRELVERMVDANFGKKQFNERLLSERISFFSAEQEEEHQHATTDREVAAKRVEW